MRYLCCFCCKQNADIELESSNATSISNDESPARISYISESPKFAASVLQSRVRTTSTSSMKSIKSFYSTRSRSSNADDYYSICSADSFQSVMR